jgi:hypothetical protein
VLERIVETCIAAGLADGEGFAVDASLIAADANKQRSIAGQYWRRDRDPSRSSRAVKEYLATLDDPAWGADVSPSDPGSAVDRRSQGTGISSRTPKTISSTCGVIDVEGSLAICQAEVGAAKTMIKRTEDALVSSQSDLSRIPLTERLPY